MKFKVDEDLPTEYAPILRQAGFEVDIRSPTRLFLVLAIRCSPSVTLGSRSATAIIASDGVDDSCANLQIWKWGRLIARNSTLGGLAGFDSKARAYKFLIAAYI